MEIMYRQGSLRSGRGGVPQGTPDGRATACRLAEAARRDRRITDAREDWRTGCAS